MTAFTLAEIQERTYKKRDAWWTVFLVDPLAGRLVVWTANHTSITPNQLTFGAGLLGLGAAACFTQATWPWLVAGALLFHLSFVLDCMDGKIARLKGTGTVFGAWVDFVFDRIRFACMMALLSASGSTPRDRLSVAAPPLTFDLLRHQRHADRQDPAHHAAAVERVACQQNDQPEQSENEPPPKTRRALRPRRPSSQHQQPGRQKEGVVPDGARVHEVRTYQRLREAAAPPGNVRTCSAGSNSRVVHRGT